MKDYSKKPSLPRRTVNIAGLKVQVVSDEECLNAEMAIAMPADRYRKLIAEGASFIEGTQPGFPCKVCGQDCVLAPSGQQLHAQGLQYTCMECFIHLLDTEKAS